MNRGEEQDIERANVGLTKQLIGACEASHSKPHVLFANSTQQDRGTAYGRSKKVCADLLKTWGEASGATVTNLILPNVFGEGGRPFYNSVVATFCYQLAAGEKPRIIEDRSLEFVHAQMVARDIAQRCEASVSDDIFVEATLVSVSEVLARLEDMAAKYREHTIPDLTVPFDLDLFNTYRSYLFPKHYPVKVAMKTDARGYLFEAVKTAHGGQCFLSSTNPGITRGNHYHTRKFERFMVISGRAMIRLRRLFSQTIEEFHVSGEVPQYVDMPTFHTHSITNTGDDDLVTLFWSSEIFDPTHPDTYRETV